MSKLRLQSKITTCYQGEFESQLHLILDQLFRMGNLSLLLYPSLIWMEGSLVVNARPS
jgi:hypothetical protein